MLPHTRKFFWIYCAVITLSACNTAAAPEAAPVEEVKTPVTITTISEEPIADYIELNATSSFLQKSIVKANANGYIESVNTQIGKHVTSNQVLFSVKTKESQSIGNAISILDSTLKFQG